MQCSNDTSLRSMQQRYIIEILREVFSEEPSLALKFTTQIQSCKNNDIATSAWKHGLQMGVPVQFHCFTHLNNLLNSGNIFAPLRIFLALRNFVREETQSSSLGQPSVTSALSQLQQRQKHVRYQITDTRHWILDSR